MVSRLGSGLHGGPVTPADLAELADKLYFDRDPGGDAYLRFWVLLVLSTVIATGGVMTDSTAAVIGAMIVAPLMTPIMASALAVVTGDLSHLGRSLAMVAGGVVVAIGLSWAIAFISPTIVTEASNSQIAARVAPRTLDFVVALASGAAGAFAISRAKVIDALPGVAIAISLVPPLCVVGVTLANGEPSAAAGALLLFATNFLAILAAGGGTLALMGFGRVALAGVSPHARRRVAAVIVIASLVVLIPLAATSARVIRDSLIARDVNTWAETSLPDGVWLAGTSVVEDEVVILLDSDGPADAAALTDAGTVFQATHPDLTIRLIVSEETVIVLPGGS